MSTNNIVHVAVAVIKDSHGQYLIAKRPQKSHQGGLWEFPGGKVESHETVLDALKRELFEEIGITLIQATPLIKIHHDYSDKSVLLDVWTIDKFTGKAFGKEGQETCWVNQINLSLYDFPEANIPIIKAIQLPDRYMITGQFNDENDLLVRIKLALKMGLKLIQFRAKGLSEEKYFKYAKKIHAVCRGENAKLLLNTSVELYKKNNAIDFSDGIHLSSKELTRYSKISIGFDLIVSASIHNLCELKKVEDFDFIVLSPVNETLSHPNSPLLGWDGFKQLTEKATCPVYALGGMTEKDITKAKENGAQGISSISTFWKNL